MHRAEKPVNPHERKLPRKRGSKSIGGYRTAVKGSRALPLRTHPLVFGVVVFLASELMFFAALFAAYYNLRSLNSPWPPPGVHLRLLESSIGTALLALSSFSMIMVSRYLARERVAMSRGWLGITIVLGTVFFAIAMHGWAGNTFRIDTNAYGSLFYTMTGFHALHVIVGIILMVGLFAGMRRPAFLTQGRAGAEAISYYWHFVFVVWLGIWGSIYLIR